MCRILRCLEAPGAAEGWKCECLEDPGSGKLNVSYSTVSGGSREVWWLDLTNVLRILGGSVVGAPPFDAS